MAYLHVTPSKGVYFFYFANLFTEWTDFSVKIGLDRIAEKYQKHHKNKTPRSLARVTLLNTLPTHSKEEKIGQ